MANIELNPDIQTGRNVYVDADLYESDDAYKAKVDRYVNEGFRLVYGSPDTPDEPSEGGSAGSGNTASAEALLVEVTINPTDGVNAQVNKTFGEIKEAVFAGRAVYFCSPSADLVLDIELPEGSVMYFPLTSLLLNAGDAAGGMILSEAVIEGLFADTDDDYPSYSEPAGTE